MNKTKPKKIEVSNFIEKLIEILENSQINDTISWRPSGDGFIISNVSKFVDEVLPTYFKHKNISSFIRQLNMYGFSKLREDDLQNCYTHPNFCKTNVLQSKKIKRKHQIKNCQFQQQESVSHKFQQEINEMKIKQNKIQETLTDLVKKHDILLKQYESITSKLVESERLKSEYANHIFEDYYNNNAYRQNLNNQIAINNQQDNYLNQLVVLNQQKQYNVDNDEFFQEKSVNQILKKQKKHLNDKRKILPKRKYIKKLKINPQHIHEQKNQRLKNKQSQQQLQLKQFKDFSQQLMNQKKLKGYNQEK